jgi:glycosyltransferase involved in cell wall biosynthesis
MSDNMSPPMTLGAAFGSRPLAAPRHHRVLMLIDHLEVGGAQRHLALLARELVEAGHQVHVLHTGEQALDLDPSVVVVRALAGRVARRQDSRLDAVVERYAARIKPSVLHAHLYASSIAGGRAAAKLGIPLVVTHHSAGTWQRPADRRLMLAVLRGASCHLAVSPQIEDALLDQGLPASRVEFIPNGVPVPGRPVRRRPGDSLRVGFLGRLDRDKDPVLAVESLAQAHALGSRACLELRGEGPLSGEVREAVNRLGLEPHVRLGGFVAQAARFYGAIDVLLLSSRSEGMPLVVLEAMGHELPVVATRVGAVGLEVQDGMTGLLAEPGDPAGLGEAIAWLDAHPAERLRFGRQGRRRLREFFTVERMALEVSRTYDRVAEAARGAARTAS